MNRTETWEQIIDTYGHPIYQSLIRGKYTESERLHGDIPREIAIFKLPDQYPGGIIIYARYNQQWHANAGQRWTVKHLLERQCMYCEKELKPSEAIVICKECTE